MTPRPARAWSRTITVHGVRVRIFERAPGSVLYREVRLEGRKDRQSLGHRDRALAEQQARELATRGAELLLAGRAGAVTLGQLGALYVRHRAPLLSAERQRSVRGMLSLLERHFSRDFLVEDLSPHAIAGYVAARRSGVLQ